MPWEAILPDINFCVSFAQLRCVINSLPPQWLKTTEVAPHLPLIHIGGQSLAVMLCTEVQFQYSQVSILGSGRSSTSYLKLFSLPKEKPQNAELNHTIFFKTFVCNRMAYYLNSTSHNMSIGKTWEWDGELEILYSRMGCNYTISHREFSTKNILPSILSCTKIFLPTFTSALECKAV